MPADGRSVAAVSVLSPSRSIPELAALLDRAIDRDPEFGPVRVRAFGTYAFKVIDPGTFIREVVSTDPMFEVFEIANQFRNAIVSRFVDTLGSQQIPLLDLVGNYERVSKLALDRISPELAKMGVALTQFFVENVSVPPEVEAAIDKRSQMGVLGNRPVIMDNRYGIRLIEVLDVVAAFGVTQG